MKYYHCTQYRSSIRVSHTQRKVLKSLGLGKLGNSKVLPACPSVLGMIHKVEHLVRMKIC
ncbi:50S ribosomal protein L30 [Holospora curviuscula]|uniref:50S ribosomal protein L30 n=1 Tax=Holospora curviuscula TaxID=1082868 RepID=A0A2S5R8H8_9PROT|nr:50S ribosomal protein L30 [Holospora curviuscula]PPE03641.1 50S ribosomal protein L30 [Holospora curviuscula]